MPLTLYPGAKSDLAHDQEGIDKAKDCLRVGRYHVYQVFQFLFNEVVVARDAGINLFDNAETYGNPRGAAESIMGEAIRQLREENPELWRRSDLIITTKLFWGGDGVNEKGLSKKHIMVCGLYDVL